MDLNPIGIKKAMKKRVLGKSEPPMQEVNKANALVITR